MKTILAALIMALLSSPSLADAPIRPDPRLTPGAVATTDANLVCQPGYSKSARHTSGKLKSFIYREYGIDRRGPRPSGDLGGLAGELPQTPPYK